MHRPHAPTVRPLLPVRRLVAGALATGAGVSTCNYSAASKTLSVTDLSGTAALRLVRVGDQIRIADGKAGTNSAASRSTSCA